MKWYTAEELKKYLHLQNYSDEIIKELAEQYATNLQLAFEKGRSVAENKRPAPDSITLVSSEADFEKNTWTFTMPEGTRVGAGAYALIKI
jgi:hypothetical protein